MALISAGTPPGSINTPHHPTLPTWTGSNINRRQERGEGDFRPGPDSPRTVAPASRACGRRAGASFAGRDRLRHRRVRRARGAEPDVHQQRGLHRRYAARQRYTCHGAKINPPLNWSGAPPGTKSLALIVDDSSAPITPFIYWLVFDINPGATDIQERSLPTGARQALNSADTATYDAPCPNGYRHSYRFTIYALRTTLNLPNGAPLESVWTAIAAATIGRGRITVTGNP